MKLRLFFGATAILAAVALAGCSAPSAGPEPSSPSGTSETSEPGGAEMLNPTKAEVAQLVADGHLPKGFPADASNIRVIQEGDKIAATWTGGPIDATCEASTERVGSYAGMLLIQDAPITDTEQCGDVWQAKQVDGSRLLWNTSAE